MALFLRRCARLLGLASLLAAAGLTATACSPPPGPCPTGPVVPGLAIAVGDRADSPRPAWPATLDLALTRIIAATKKAGPHAPGQGVTLVRVDGAPSIGCVVTYDDSARNAVAQQRAASVFMAYVQEQVAALRATAPQADPLTAISRASAAAGPGGTVVLIDSGLQTVAPLDFGVGDLLGADVGTVVSGLSRAGELPDLRGRKVILDGIGYTAAPQRQLDEAQRRDLVHLWQEIAAAAGATSVVTVATPNTSPSDPGLPDVSTVPVAAPPAIRTGCGTESVLADSGSVGFVANSTVFRDERAARDALAHLASWLSTNPAAAATLTGSIAHYGRDDPNGLSRSRAARIRRVLLELGARPGQVTAVGVGWGPFPSKDAPPDPTADPRNRRVVVQISCT